MKEPGRRNLFFVTMALFYLSTCLVHPVTPALIVDRQLDSSMFGVALAAMNLMNFLFSPMWGRLSGRKPVKHLLLVSCLGYGLGQMIFAMAHSEWLVMVGRMFAGAFVGGVFTASAAYVVGTSPDPKARGRNLTVMVTLQSVLNAVGYFAGGMIGVKSTELAFLVQAGALVVTGLLFYLCCGDYEPENRGEPLSLRQLDPFGAFREAKQFMTPMLALVLAVLALSSMGKDAFEHSFNFALKDQFGLSSAYNGGFKAAIAVVSLVINGSLGLWLIRKTDLNRSLFFVVLGCTLPLSAVVFSRSLVIFAAADILFFGFHALLLPVLQNLAADRSRQGQAAKVMGFYNAMKSLGGILGALCAGLIYKLDPYSPFYLAALAFLAATGIAWIYGKKSRS